MTSVLNNRTRKRTASTSPGLPEVRVVTPEQGWVLFDEAAQSELGIGGEEFLRRWFGGDYADNPDQPGVVNVEMLLPFVRERVQEYLRTHEDKSGTNYLFFEK